MASVKLPILLNGIDSTVMRGDLLERSIMLKLPRITPREPAYGARNLGYFARVASGLLGCAAGCRKHWPAESAEHHADGRAAHVRLLPWLTACEPALPWKPGAFMAIYRGKLEDANSDLAENDSVASALMEWAEQTCTPGTSWNVVAKDLLVALNEITRETGPRTCDTGPPARKPWPIVCRALPRSCGRRESKCASCRAPIRRGHVGKSGARGRRFRCLSTGLRGSRLMPNELKSWSYDPALRLERD